jgi:hypothetical protein
MRVGVWLKRASIVLLIVACMKIAVETAELAKNIYQYRKETKVDQEKINRLAKAIVQQVATDANFPNVSPPDIRVGPEGPDMKLEAGYLNLNSTSYSPANGEAEHMTAISDYAPGSYQLNAAPNAHLVIEALIAGIDEFFADKVDGHVVEAEVIGNADGLPVKTTYTYSGDLGTITHFPYYSYNTNKMEEMSLIPNVTSHTNESIAFLRALDVIRYASRSPRLKTAHTRISTYVNPQTGSEYRRVILRLTIKDALGEQYNKIPPILRKAL